MSLLTEAELDACMTLGADFPATATEDERAMGVDIRRAQMDGDNDLAYQLSREFYFGWLHSGGGTI